MGRTASSSSSLSSSPSLGDLLQRLAGLSGGEADLDALTVIVADLLTRRIREEPKPS